MMLRDPDPEVKRVGSAASPDLGVLIERVRILKIGRIRIVIWLKVGSGLNIQIQNPFRIELLFQYLLTELMMN